MRLRNTRDIQRVQRLGRRIRLPHMLVLYMPGNLDQSRVGFTVSRKVGNSVVRNRVKRWLREAVWENKVDIPTGIDFVVIAHPQAATAGFEILNADVKESFSKMSQVA
jgi:ribonuclease P protein component